MKTLFAALVAALALVLTGAATAPAPAATATCKAGQTSVTLGSAHRCVKASTYLPKPAPSTSFGSDLGRRALDRDLENAIDKHFRLPAKVHESTVDDTVAARAAKRIEPIAHRLLARAPKQEGPRVAQSARAASDFTVSATEAIPGAESVNGTVTVEGNIPLGNDGQLDASSATIGFTFNFQVNGAKISHGFRAGMNEAVKLDSPCPAANGDLHGTSTVNLDVHTETQPGGGVDYDNSLMSMHSAGASNVIVKPTAKLGTINFHDTLGVTEARQVSVLHGLVVNGYRLVISVSWAGTVDGSSGDVSLSSLTAHVTGTARGWGSGNLASTLAQLNADPNIAEQWREYAVDEGKILFNHYHDAEEKLREPNHCAKITFDPDSSDRLAQGTTLTVNGRVGPKDGGASDSIWGSPTIKRGQVRGIPTSTAAAQPAQIKVTGGAPDANQVTGDFEVRASSRAGVAEKEWIGKNAGWLVTISGPVTSEEPCCWNVSGTASVSVRVTQQTVGGVTGFHGTGTFAYSGVSSASNGTPIQCTYAVNGVTGSAGVTIKPSADGATLSLTLQMSDHVDGTITCPNTGPQTIGTVLVASVYYQTHGHPVVTVPASLPQQTHVTWSTSPPLQSNGNLTVTVAPLT